MIEAHGIGLRRGETTILDAIDLRVSPSEVVAILGPNGAGKSSLLGVLAGGLMPTSGEVLLQGRPLGRWSLREQSRVRAVVTQEASQNPPLSVAEVVALGRSSFGDSTSAAHAHGAVREAMTETDTLQFADRPYVSLSAGERQRVQMARAFAQIATTTAEPRALLLDEPTSNMDMQQEHILLHKVRGRSRLGIAVVLVIHDINLAIAYADRLVLIHGGRIAVDGAPRAVVTKANLLKVFGVEVELIDRPTGPSPFVLPVPLEGI